VDLDLIKKTQRGKTKLASVQQDTRAQYVKGGDSKKGADEKESNVSAGLRHGK